MKKIVGFILLGIAGIACIIFYSMAKQHRSQAAAPSELQTINQPTLGQPTAPLHFVIYEDLKCRGCREFNLSVLPYIKQRYVDTGRGSYTVVLINILSPSRLAFIASQCAYRQGNAAFFSFVQRVYQQQPSESQDWENFNQLIQFTNGLSEINQKQLAECMIHHDFEQQLADNLHSARVAMKHGLIATPSLYINGYLVRPLTKEHVLQQAEQILGAQHAST